MTDDGFNDRDPYVPTLYTIYNRPKDFPEHFVVRRFTMDQPTPFYRLGKTLAEARAFVPKWTVGPIGRDLEDDPVIVETWL